MIYRLNHIGDYESPLTAISFISFFEKKFKPIGAGLGYSIVTSLSLPRAQSRGNQFLALVNIHILC